MPLIHLTTTITEELAGMRVDQALSELYPQYSRTRLQKWIKNNQVTIDNAFCKPKTKVSMGQKIEINAEIEPQDTWEPQPIKLNIVHEDEDIIIINKPINLVIHPAPGNPDQTLLNGLLYHHPQLIYLPRAGIVHRLDKNTSGLLVVAKNLAAHNHLVTELQNRKIKRQYEAIVHGVMISGGTVNAPIGRHPVNRKKMAVINNGKPAITHYRVIKRFAAHTQVKIFLETGRTHQIRVHMAHINHPIIGDKTYGAGHKQPHFPRQALHAKRLGFIHPSTKKYTEWQTPLPDDMLELLAMLNQ
jgi:23S rRNA pseudouridine1911/1915/1917 synthase